MPETTPAAAHAQTRSRVRPLEDRDLPATAELLAARHRGHRRAEPEMDPQYEDAAATQQQVERLLADPTASGWVAEVDGSIRGFLIGVARDAGVWGANAWVEAPGHAAAEPAVVRDLYAVAAAHWMAEGRNNHHVLVPATDRDLVDAWFSLDFGQQHLHAVRETPGPELGVVARSELVIRDATPEDIPGLVPLEQALPAHLVLSPVFSRQKPMTDDEVVAELREDLAGTTYHFFVAEHEGRVVGTAIGCSLEVSPGATGLNRPSNAGYLAYAAVLPEARGLGAGRALGETVLAWARDAGYPRIATDWRSANLEADGAWRGLGFRPSFRRLHRSII